MSSLFEEQIEIPLSNSFIRGKYVTTAWAKGFCCSPNTCGLCCITELPNEVSKKTFTPFQEPVCAHYNISRKICQSYNKRPLGCRMYPFIFGVENGELVISPSLECPGTNSQELNHNIIKQALNDPFFENIINFYRGAFENAYLSRYWNTSKGFIDSFHNTIKGYLADKPHFPFIGTLTEVMYTCADQYFHEKAKSSALPPINKLLQDIANGKSFITNNAGIPSLECFKISNKKVQSILWDPETGETKTLEPRIVTKSIDCEISSEASKLLNDYIDLLFKRPFLSLSALGLARVPRKMSEFYVGNLVGSFIHLEVAANLLAYRFVNETIQRNDMRDIISLADGCLLSLFRQAGKNPDRLSNSTN